MVFKVSDNDIVRAEILKTFKKVKKMLRIIQVYEIRF
jgi:hypothetical protein